jgi:hypothetical protein
MKPLASLNHKGRFGRGGGVKKSKTLVALLTSAQQVNGV